MPRTLLHRLSVLERAEVLDVARRETTGGVLVLVAAVLALVWANSPWDAGYAWLHETAVGPERLHLHLTLVDWAKDGLLAVFFLVAGLELKRELVVGELRNVGEAVLPVTAALTGMVVPAAVYLAVTRGSDGTASGWAVPMATDIAFALAVLAIAAPAVPTALRAFLLTLAVVDDLGAVTVIAVFYTDRLAWAPLAGAAAALLLYAALQHRRVSSPLVLVPLGLLVWVLVHASGVHATVAGVLVGLLTRVRRDPGEHESPAERLEHRMRPVSAVLCVPAFALVAAGVPVTADVLRAAASDAAALGVVAGLVLGKPVGVLAGAYTVARFTRAELSPGLRWRDVAGVGLLAGVGFTVSLLIGELAFAGDPARVEHVTLGILAGSLASGTVAAVVLRRRNRAYRLLDEDEPESVRDSGVG